ncbi:MAG: hypothetical protein ACXVGN_00010 [Mycobacteriaceae bacterium]
MSAATKVLSVEDVRALLVRAVEEKGADYVCSTPGMYLYFKNGEPSCIVGHVLAYLGFGPEHVVEGARAHRLPVLSPLRPMVGLALTAAQGTQDNGATWGEALAEFDRVVAESQS